jgi:hypothetical protein
MCPSLLHFLFTLHGLISHHVNIITSNQGINNLCFVTLWVIVSPATSLTSDTWSLFLLHFPLLGLPWYFILLFISYFCDRFRRVSFVCPLNFGTSKVTTFSSHSGSVYEMLSIHITPIDNFKSLSITWSVLLNLSSYLTLYLIYVLVCLRGMPNFPLPWLHFLISFFVCFLSVISFSICFPMQET